jgi:hypothetical protein
MGIKEQLINLETAILAKSKGFDLTVLFYYDGSDMVATQAISPFNILNYNKNKGSTFRSAPTQSLLQKWLREEHNIFVQVLLDQTTEPKFAVEIFEYSHFGNYKENKIEPWYLYKIYEEALEVGLKEGLKIIK